MEQGHPANRIHESCCMSLPPKNSAKQREHDRARILTLPLADDVIKTEREPGWDYVYEPDAQVVIDDLLMRYVEALIYQAVAENMASEQSARMVAMKSASDNAKSVIGELKLVYNKARQAAITKELSEIVSGAAAV